MLMLTTGILVLEVAVLIGSFLDFDNRRLISGRDFTALRKVLALQSVIVLILVVFLQIVGTATGEQHDGASKSIAGRLGSAIQSYAANTGGSVAGFTCSSYCNGIVDPDTNSAPVAGTVATASSGVVYTLGKDCAGTTSPTSYAIYYWQQRGSSSQCLDSQ